MDLKEIQALHAQYTAQPVIIDIASHTAAMPALPAPERGATAHVRAVELIGGLRKAGKPAFIALAIAAVAAAGGMSIARIWHAMHETVATPTVAVAPDAAKQASAPASEPTDERPIDVAPARPLTSNDFDAGKAATHSALSNVDTRTLAASASLSPVNLDAPVARPAEQNVAAASPIRAQRPATPVAPPTSAPASPPAQLTPTATAAAPVAQPASVPAKAAMTAPPQDAAKPETRPALRPLHRITRHTAAPASNEASPEAAVPAQPKAQPGKSGDVQLF